MLLLALLALLALLFQRTRRTDFVQVTHFRQPPCQLDSSCSGTEKRCSTAAKLARHWKVRCQTHPSCAAEAVEQQTGVLAEDRCRSAAELAEERKVGRRRWAPSGWPIVQLGHAQDAAMGVLDRLRHRACSDRWCATWMPLHAAGMPLDDTACPSKKEAGHLTCNSKAGAAAVYALRHSLRAWL